MERKIKERKKETQIQIKDQRKVRNVCTEIDPLHRGSFPRIKATEVNCW